MFKKENRLPLETNFFNSKTYSTPQFVFKIKKNEANVNRFGIVVSKKIDSKAVGRNKIKRLLRSSLIALNGKMSQGHDILLIVKNAAAKILKEENMNLFEKFFSKVGLIKE